MSERDDLIERVTQELRRPVPTSAAAKARVMYAVRRTRPEITVAGAWKWLVRPRPVMVSPFAGVALAAGLAMFAVLVPRQQAGRDAAAVVTSSQTQSALPAGEQTVGREHAMQFVLAAPHASRVSLVGSFNDWDPAATPLRRTPDGMWAAVVSLEPGLHIYAFVVDGTDWVPDPTAPRAPDDDFGKSSSVAIIGENRT